MRKGHLLYINIVIEINHVNSINIVNTSNSDLLKNINMVSVLIKIYTMLN
jgi:hypothetical protein